MVDSFIVLPDGSLTLLEAKDVTVRGYLINNIARIIYLGGRDDAKLNSLDIQLRNFRGAGSSTIAPQNPPSTNSLRLRT